MIYAIILLTFSWVIILYLATEIVRNKAEQDGRPIPRRTVILYDILRFPFLVLLFYSLLLSPLLPNLLNVLILWYKWFRR